MVVPILFQVGKVLLNCQFTILPLLFKSVSIPEFVPVQTVSVPVKLPAIVTESTVIINGDVFTVGHNPPLCITALYHVV